MSSALRKAWPVLLWLACQAPSPSEHPVLPEAFVSTAGFQAYLDPATGRFVEPSAEIGLRAAARAAPAPDETSAVGLVERPSGSPAGGFAVHLGGRFRSFLVATRDEGGEVHLECLAGAAEGGGKRR